MNELETSSSLYTYLFIGNDFINGNLPYSNQWEMKGPILPLVYGFLAIATSGKILYLKLASSLMIYFMSIMIFNYNIKSSDNTFIAYSASLFFNIFLASYSFGYSIYYEYFLCILIYVLIYKVDYFSTRPVFLGILVAFGSLYFQFFIVFGVALLVKINSLRRLTRIYISKGILGFLICQIIIFFVFFINGLSEIYIYTIFKFPFLYQENVLYDVGPLTLFYYLKDNESLYLLASLISLAVYILIQLKHGIKKQIFTNFSEIIFICAGFFLPIYTNKLSGNHWIYFIFFVSLFIGNFFNQKDTFIAKVLVTFLIVAVSGQISINKINLHDISNISYKSEELAEKIIKDGYKIETSFVMNVNNIQTFLNTENISYISHPTLRKKNQIGGLERLIQSDQSYESLVKKNPDLIVCNVRKDFCGALSSNKNYFLYDQLKYDKVTLDVYLNRKTGK